MRLEAPVHGLGHTLSRKSSHCTHGTSVPHVQITSESLLQRKQPEHLRPATKTREPRGRSGRTGSWAHVPRPGKPCIRPAGRRRSPTCSRSPLPAWPGPPIPRGSAGVKGTEGGGQPSAGSPGTAGSLDPSSHHAPGRKLRV